MTVKVLQGKWNELKVKKLPNVNYIVITRQSRKTFPLLAPGCNPWLDFVVSGCFPVLRRDSSSVVTWACWGIGRPHCSSSPTLSPEAGRTGRTNQRCTRCGSSSSPSSKFGSSTRDPSGEIRHGHRSDTFYSDQPRCL